MKLIPFNDNIMPLWGCWIWQGPRTAKGYATCHRGFQRLVHILMYETFNGPVPEGMELDHLCRNPPCVNPAHLEPVTHKENCARGSKAQQTRCKRGHPFTSENTRIIMSQNGTPCRSCIQCERYRAMEYYKKRVGRDFLAIAHKDKIRCHKGHPFTVENTYYHARGRSCRTCQRERMRVYRSSN